MDVLSLVTKVLSKNGLSRADVLYACISSDNFYNLPSTNTSYYCVISLPINDFFGLLPPMDTWVFTQNDIKEGESVVVRVDEIKKFCRLILNANPLSVEILYTNDALHSYQSEEWKTLVNKRDSYLTRYVIDHYLGFARSNLDILQKVRPKTSKFETLQLIHIMRLLYSAEMIIKGGKPIVYFEGEQRDNLMRFSAGHSVEDLKNARDMYDLLYSGLDKAPYPPNVLKQDEEFLNDWLVNVRISISRAKGLFDSKLRLYS
eukprot:TRINITY_DN5878_c0_g1_i4.p1 TRINITY_DN5878_c0_g1~~TRINITY_DN5878_c0_g1_i4.p1  ORF type:complete len:260 (+),score=31.81 TRINITY_DN5878_c0_g1_i4:99-878(+)